MPENLQDLGFGSMLFGLVAALLYGLFGHWLPIEPQPLAPYLITLHVELFGVGLYLGPIIRRRAAAG